MPPANRSPSELYNEMKRVAGTSLSDCVLLNLWIERLPPHARGAITAADVQLAQRLRIADSIIESLNASKAEEVSSTLSDFQQIQKEIAALSRDVSHLLDSRKSRTNSRSRSQSRSRSRSRNSAHDVCWYHATYKEKANNCRKPCAFGKKLTSTSEKSQ
ncbi:PREDICTED: uncharacterized protein LOC108359732 [Rhagoletis zephyria]|uniref:uncharacterized protein LOC108359732 n=1 Tax=Rhagoletis zephyria TaxID=28612 RepID=UPI0008115094|nr:PREDICTED: uncharacterized protein LOC108359732 [Rhagoletis zephyria]